MQKRPKRPSKEKILELYLRWLSGETLRQLADTYPVKISHSTICIWFNKTFGKGSSNPHEKSHLRSLLEDNPGDPLVREWVVANIHTKAGHSVHRSEHSIGQLSRYQVVHDPKLMDYIAPTGNDPWHYVDPDYRDRWDFLRLPYLRYMLEAIYWLLMTMNDTEA